MRKLRCTISGSFRRFLPEIKRTADRFRKLGVEVISPSNSRMKTEVDEFVILEGDRGRPKAIEQRHLEAIRQSDFLYVVNPDRQVGTSATFEIGYAIANAVPVFCSASPKEYILGLFAREEPSLGKVKRLLSSASLPPVPSGASLAALQAFVRNMVRVRGFEEESVQDVVLLLVEELGELAKAIRLEVGLKVHVKKRARRRRTSEELADCLIYLLDIANLLNIQLSDALRRKEATSKRRAWAAM